MVQHGTVWYGVKRGRTGVIVGRIGKLGVGNTGTRSRQDASGSRGRELVWTLRCA